ncbi:MAG: YpdA family putative bacillithiol disulfide reductase [Bernardetiaceae bacterium]|jgi:putative YpdA family bacillithiol system oxidoreductase|nr:YpdA family putative bacillithiol disulfide reductase [Bernardetiaceae bacterium]
MSLPVYQLLIVGGGPIGLACGIEASKAGLPYLILEKGCLVNSLYHYPQGMTFFSTADRLEIGGVPFIAHGEKPTRREALDYYRRVASHWQLQLKLYEAVTQIETLPAGGPVRLRVRTSRGEYLAQNLVFATGFYDQPNWLGIPGEELPKVRHYFTEAHPYAFQKVVVVGAANSAVDAALETYRKGAEVTMIVRQAEVRPGVKYWVRPDIINRIQEGSIKAYFNSQLTAIRPGEVDVATPQGPITLANDFVLAMTGYRPDYGLFEQVGLQIGTDPMQKPYYEPLTHQTNVPGVYLAGVACGGLETNKWFIENSRGHAELIVGHITAQLAP